MSELREKNMVTEKELQLLAKNYAELDPANRSFLIVASGLLLTSQSNTEEMLRKKNNGEAVA